MGVQRRVAEGDLWSKMIHPPPAAVLVAYVLCALVWGELLITLRLPDQLAMALIIPVLLAAYGDFPRWLYLVILGLSAAAAVWVTYHLSSSFVSSLETIATTTIIVGGVAELIYRLMQERRRTEQALRSYAIEMEARNRELDAFAHTVAHDLKGPLASMLTSGEILNRLGENLTEERLHRYLEGIRESGRKMSSIIDELLLLASVRQMARVKMAPLEMGDVVQGALRRLEVLIQVEGAQISVPEVWPAALGYGPWVEEVWTNYISNAVKYGGRPPRVELGAEPAGEDRVRFWVRDNGKGLSREQQARIFMPFERLGQVQVGGHGLGLSIAQRIVDRLGGEVGVESSDNSSRGSLFYFTLPALISD